MTAFLDAVVSLPGTWQFWPAVVATAVAGLMRGYAGFGTAILLSPVFSTLWGPLAAVPVMLLMELLVSVQLLPKAMGHADRRTILPLGLAAVIATPFGAWVLLSADGEVLRRSIGFLVLVFGFLLMSGWRYHGTRPTGLNVAVGATAGLMKGATGMSGPPVILYLLAGAEEARQHRASLILFFAMISVVSVVIPIWAGLVGALVLAKLLLLLPIMLICVPIGARLFHVVPVVWYRRFALVFLTVAGSFALFF
ncbi:sulfite exporter TauE/SafE family protein [Humitalea sp. 24SJ18S-53]|uniref:sulfite exporter TauE/SafE family protein n=1 Tax=Humitalea sp. 24SJ18S-53 TaxID=3422307 RepID=UPI003D67BAAC